MNWKWPQQLELSQQVGEGWSGAIYLAQDRDSPRQVYTRVLSEAARAALGPLTELLRFQATAQHPHLLPTTLPETSGGETFYSVQVAERGSLRTLSERYRASGQRLDPLTALDLIRQIGLVLAFAHAQGVTHGNLKPENVLLHPGRSLLGREGVHVLLSDFGLNSLRPAGSSPYLSPRQRRIEAGKTGDAEGFGTATVQDDLYGLGALLYFALSGQDPPPELSPAALHTVGLEQRPLVGRALGLLTPFGSVADFLESLSQHLPGASAVTLQAEQLRLRLVPGEPVLTRIRVQTVLPLSAALLVEGLPPEWVSLPPAIQLQAGQEISLPLTLTAPRRTDTRCGEREVRLLLVRTQAGGPGELLAQQTLTTEVAPFHAGKLSLFAPPGSVGSRVHLELELRNVGNAAQRYALDPQLPAGAALLGPLPAPLTLEPGEVSRAALELRLPPALLRGQRREIGVVAQVLGQGGAASSRALRAGAVLRQRPALPLWVQAGLLGLVALGSWQAARVPSIGAFTVQAVSGAGEPRRGEAFTLSWKTAGARQVEIAQLPQRALALVGSAQLPGLSGPQTYTLRARGWWRFAQQTVTVRPLAPAAVITALSVTPPTANYGEAVTVRWAVRNVPQGQQLRLGPLGEVPSQGVRTVILKRDTTFELVVPGSAAGRERRASTTATLRPPAIMRLSAAPGQVSRSGDVTLSWQVSGARQVRLSVPELGGLELGTLEPGTLELSTLPLQGSRTVRVPANAASPLRYVLKASNGQTEVSATAAVNVASPPVITAFRVLPQNPVVGQPVKVFWRTSGAQRVELRWGGERQVLPPQSQMILTAAPELRVVSLLAQSSGLPSATRSVTLEPQRPAQILKPVALKPLPAAVPVAPAAVLIAPAAVPVAPAAVPTASLPSTRSPVSVKSAPINTVPVKVIGFRSETPSPVAGAPITVRWTVRGARQVALRSGVGQRLGLYPAQGSATLPPQPAGTLELQLTLPQDPRPLARLPLIIGDGEAAAPPVTVSNAAPSAVQSSAASSAQNASAAVKVRDFRAVPAQVQPGQATTLFWRVTGTKKVVISGIRGPNPDGSFPPAYSILTPRLRLDTTYALRAGDIRRTAQVRVNAPAAARSTSALSTSAPSTSAPSRYQALGGAWVHSLGQLNIQVSGSRVTGTLSSSGGGLPSGTLRGALSGPADAASFSGYLLSGHLLSGSELSGSERVAVILKFTSDTAFQGVYMGTSRQTWCGGRGPALPRC